VLTPQPTCYKTFGTVLGEVRFRIEPAPLIKRLLSVGIVLTFSRHCIYQYTETLYHIKNCLSITKVSVHISGKLKVYYFSAPKAIFKNTHNIQKGDTKYIEETKSVVNRHKNTDLYIKK
jgi:hypothetical protein